jgi:anionic cell wall polymer biosynthesis LytR-Cps2A-Psr (LCP) family protein
VCLNAPVHDPYSGVDMPGGRHLVSGPGALAFVRQRHGLGGGDLDRIARQHAFAAGLAQRVLTAGTLADPARLQRLADIATRYVVLDRGWDLAQALAQLRRISGDEFTFHTIPTGRPDLSTPVDGIAVEIDRDAVRTFVESLLEPTATPASTGPGTSTRPTVAPTAARPADHAPPISVQPADGPHVTRTPSPPVISAEGVPCVD